MVFGAVHFSGSPVLTVSYTQVCSDESKSYQRLCIDAKIQIDCAYTMINTRLKHFFNYEVKS